MSVEHHKANLGNLGEEFLDNDPQQSSDKDRILSTQPGLEEDQDATDEDEVLPLDFAADYSDDVTLGSDIDKTGPLDTAYLIPAPGQALNADDEPGGMYGSTADELLGSPGPDEQDLGTLEGDVAPARLLLGESFEETGIDGARAQPLVELQSGRNVQFDAPEDVLSTDLPLGGTDEVVGEVIDSETGELTDYDDDKQVAEI